MSPCADLARVSATLNGSDLSSEAAGSWGARPGRVRGRTSAGGRSEAPRCRQGSEYPVVILPILDGPKMLFNRNLLYTAVTRAKQCVIIVGSGQKVMEMIDTDSELHRYTSLKQRITEIEVEEIMA